MSNLLAVSEEADTWVHEHNIRPMFFV